jgi:hypothetical protein
VYSGSGSGVGDTCRWISRVSVTLGVDNGEMGGDNVGVSSGFFVTVQVGAGVGVGNGPKQGPSPPSHDGSVGRGD